MGLSKSLDEPNLVAELSPERIAAVRSHLQDVLSSDAFMGGLRAQDFLRLVVEHSLAGQFDCLRERMLGAEMFGRPIDYDTGNDAVVRVKASEVRKRLTQYYLSLATRPAVQIELPAGSYAPQFHWAPAQVPSALVEPTNSHPDSIGIQIQPADTHTSDVATSPAPNREWKRRMFRTLLLAAYGAALLSLGWFAAIRFSTPHRIPKATDPLWEALFDGKRNTYIVPADIGFNFLEDLSHHQMGLADYLKGEYMELPLFGVDEHSARSQLSQRLTSFVDAQVIGYLAALPEYNPQRAFIRFPRDLRFDDIKGANAVLIGSLGSNPWASLGDSSANFRIVYPQGMEAATIINEKPQSGEQATYESRWNEPAHETFALIEYLPNLGGNGRLLLIEGLDVAGTQAAAEALFRSDAVAPTLQRASGPDGSIRPFEILVRSTSINWNATDSQIIAVRIH
jgi:hypothetical protein